jgi:hypothetical protein
VCRELEFYLDLSCKPSWTPFEQELNTARKYSTATLGQVMKDLLKHENNIECDPE